MPVGQHQHLQIPPTLLTTGKMGREKEKKSADLGTKTLFGDLISREEKEQSTSYRDNRKIGPQKLATISRPRPSFSSVARPHHPSNNISTPNFKTLDSKKRWKIIDQDLRIEGHRETSGEHQGPT